MKSEAQGFTLIELVVALAVLSLLSLLILEALNIAHQAWDRGTRAAERLDSVATVQQALRRAVSHLLPLQDSHACGGTAQSMTFLAASPDSAQRGGTARYRLDVESEGAKSNLVVTWCPYNGGATVCDNSQSAREVLVEGAAAAGLSYYEAGSWSGSWSNCALSPSLIHIDVHFADQDHRLWPALVIHPLFGAAADCRFDLVSMQCRQS